MNLRILKPKKALNKAYLKVKPHRNKIEDFKNHLISLLGRINEAETEEFHKNLVIDFLNSTYYKPEYFINTKGRNDLVIHNGKTAKTSVGVIIEAKSPTNKAEMITTENLNRKAFQELVLYYLRERITHKNLEIKHLVATNINEWFIFNATTFDRLFAQNKTLVKQFNDFENGRLAGTKTDFFYKEIAAPFIENIKAEIEFTYFNFQNYQKPLRNDSKADDNKLISLFKLLSPEHLLKLPFVNDSNSLDKKFYSELLHIIGLTETKSGSKKLIERSKGKDRNAGSILENTITRLDSLDIVSRLNKPSQFGKNAEERLFNVALELTITWINRVLFLKLMEAQLLKYHNGNSDYAFLNAKKVGSYDDLNSLFFQVLAKPLKDRNDEVKNDFGNVPYLNSSLFETTDIERETVYISSLKDDKKIPIHSQTVLKDQNGKKRKGEISTLHYLFEFLNAYDFSSEGSEEIQEENKTLINASVLGLIFEKINGYKDGSFFTPGFITMYMCRETIRKAVIQKFNETQDWHCKSIADVYDKIEDRNKANEIVNSLKICDPAVGSGHFLVSALNEIIAIKNDLKILQDREGKRLKEYQVEVVNDELVVTDEDGELFEYHPNNKESQRIQETLFHEKQTIIENCLFGVDINSNSVKICRLRLWIELLKNAYYKNETELETLPNIDINIKCGNSLISRFDLESDLKKALTTSKWNIDSYRLAVSSYRNAESKEHKREMEKLIDDIKSDFRSEISMNDPKMKRLRKLSGELFQLTQQTQLFEQTKREKAAWNKKVKELTTKTKKLETEIEEIKNNKIYENAFEWRFEFPEVLNDDGDFVGFDAVIANPPYIRQEEFAPLKTHLKDNYPVFNSTADLYVYFVSLGFNVLKENGKFAYILPNKWMRAGYGFELRQFLEKKEITAIIDFGDLPVFEEATTYPCILQVTNADNEQNFSATEIESLSFAEGLENYINKNTFIVEKNALSDSGWSLIDKKQSKLIRKIEENGKPLSELGEDIFFYGIKTGYNTAFIIDSNKKEELINEDPKAEAIIKPILKGRDIKRYESPTADNYIILAKRDIDIENYPSVYNHLLTHKEKLEKKAGSGKWYELQASPGDTEKFEQLKIMYPDISKNLNFILDTKGNYSVNTVYNIGIDSKGLLGFLNSKLFHFYFKTVSNSIRGGYFRFFTSYMENSPIPDGLEVLEPVVNQIIEQKKENSDADTTELETIIDELVFKIYGLTEEEIEIIEEFLLEDVDSITKLLESTKKLREALKVPNTISSIMEKTRLSGIGKILEATEPMRRLTERLQFNSPLSDLIKQQNKFSNLAWNSDLLKTTQRMRSLMEAVKVSNPMADFIESQKRITDTFKPTYLSSVSNSIKTIKPYQSIFNQSRTLELLNSIQNNPAIEAVKSINRQYDSIFGSIRKITNQTNQFQKTLAEINSWRLIIDRINLTALKNENWGFIQEFQENTESLFTLSDQVINGEISEEDFLNQSQESIVNNRNWINENNWWISLLFSIVFSLYLFRLGGKSTNKIITELKEIKTENKEIKAKQKNIINLVQEITSQQKNRFVTLEENTPVHISCDGSSEILDSIPKNTEVFVAYKESEWWFVNFKNKQGSLPESGWIMKKYLDREN